MYHVFHLPSLYYTAALRVYQKYKIGEKYKKAQENAKVFQKKCTCMLSYCCLGFILSWIELNLVSIILSLCEEC